MRTALAIAVFLVATLRLAGAVEPTVVPWREAGDHVGQVVTVEGQVVRAETEGDACSLEFTSDDEQAFRVVLILPMLSSARHPELRYRGQRVRATGRIQRFRGRPEMVVRSDGQIALAEELARESPPQSKAPEPTAATPSPVPRPAPVVPVVPARPVAQPAAPTPAAAAPARVPPPVPEAPAEAAPPAPRGLVEAVQQRIAPSPCDEARKHWREAAAAASSRASRLVACLDSVSYDCGRDREVLSPALAALAASEAELADVCR